MNPARSSPWNEVFVGLLLTSVASAVALYRVTDTGPLWMDAPRYANAGAMIRDYLADGFGSHPVRFAEANYAQYPAFSVPFHPPGYPAALGAAYWLFGLSPLTGRVFVAGCWAACGWLFYRLCARLGAGRWAAAGAAVLMLTTPELAVWSRDTMSEVPGLAVLLAGTVLWVRWCHGGGAGWAVGAVGLALAAFFFRVTTSGVLPGWAAYAVLSGRLDRRRLAVAAALGLAYAVVAAAWVRFAAAYSSHELTADGKGSFFLWKNVIYFAECGADLFACGTTAAMIAAWLVGRPAGRRDGATFWACWFGSYLLFKLAVPTAAEPRHFCTALPAVAGLAAVGLSAVAARSDGRWAAAGLVAVGVALNLWRLADCPPGVVGYAAVGPPLAALDRPGNLLLATLEDQDLMFHYRAAGPAVRRRCVRGDRTLAVRVSGYAGVEPRLLARSADDVLAVVRAGRIRYVVTFAPDDPRFDGRTDEMVLADRVMRDRPDLFRPVGSYPLRAWYRRPADWQPTGRVWVWEYAGPLPDGPDELDVVIPTAAKTLRAR